MRGTRTRWIQTTIMVLGGVLAALTMSACESTPKWVKTGTYTGQDSKAFYGVGEVMGIRNEPLAWDAAENRARAQMVKILSTYTAYLMRDYAASTAAGEFKKTAEEQHIEEATKTFAAATLNGVRSVDRYKDEKKGIYYVVVKMDLEDVKDMLTQSNELNSQMRDFVRKNADRAFERLEKEEQKREAPREKPQ
jgi:LPP20 lipoprotein